jgi:TetR/AcrR family transcriptional regulator, transcriptional repressor of bet genes
MAYAKESADKLNHAAERRQELLKGTLSVIARKGLSGITINDIAVEVGCSYGVVNFYFKTKERLLLAALDMLEQEYEAYWQRMMADTASTPADRLRAVIDIDFDRRVATPKNMAVWTAFWAETSRVPAYRARCGELKRRSLQRLTDLVTELAAGRDVGLPAEMIARGFYAISDGCWIYNHVTGEISPADRERDRQLCNAYLARFFPEEFRTLPPPKGTRRPPGDGRPSKAGSPRKAAGAQKPKTEPTSARAGTSQE